jgi:hypothetical protein
VRYHCHMPSHKAPQHIAEKVISRLVVGDDQCWMWPGALTGTGYGHAGWSLGHRKMVYGSTHRIAYEYLRGPIPEGLDLDHLCHDPQVCHPEKASDCPHRKCCNPDHLEPITRQENLLRGGGMAARRATVAECPQGHPYDAENTEIDNLGRRNCLACKRARNRVQYWKNRDARREAHRIWWAKNGDRVNADRRASRRRQADATPPE